jgi:thiamine-monophosphate kinase
VTQKQVEELASGLRDAERRWNVHLVGGDTNESLELVIDCAMVGFAEKVVTRGGASPGDLLVVTGKFGYSASGLKILMSGAAATAAFRERAKRSVLMPDPSLETGVALAPYLTSAMDSSDGLARSIHALAKESEVGFEIRQLPVGEGVEAFARMNGLDPTELVLEGGEEYFIVGTVKRAKLARAKEAARKAGGDLLVMGEATQKSGRVELRTGTATRGVRDGGWTHLRRS